MDGKDPVATRGAMSRQPDSVTHRVMWSHALTTKALLGSSLGQVCDERATFCPHRNATFLA